jgi:hypothetical protein
MAEKNFGQIFAATPSDTATLKEFNYIQVGITGTVSVSYKGGAATTITAGLLDRIGLVPVGLADKVLSTGTTATEIFVW